MFDALAMHKAVSVENLMIKDESTYFSKTKKILLMFRRIDNGGGKALELRHQRTCDVFFDIVDEDNEGRIPRFQPTPHIIMFSLPYLDLHDQTKEYIYRMIETMLPKAQWDPSMKVSQLKLMEM